jgi:RNA polymerase sigma factor (sigma-70 family)
LCGRAALSSARLRGKLRRLLDSQDIVQDVMMQAYGKLSDFQMRDENSFLHWLGKNAANKIRDYASAANAEKRDIRREVELEAPMADDSRSIDHPDRGTPTPSQDARRREVAEAVAECLGELSEAHRELILMRNHAQMDWQAIAARQPPEAEELHLAAQAFEQPFPLPSLVVRCGPRQWHTRMPSRMLPIRRGPSDSGGGNGSNTAGEDCCWRIPAMARALR